MATLSVIFAAAEGAEIDFDYLQRVHRPLALELWGPSGLEEVTLLRGVSGTDGREPPFLAIALLRFSSLDHLKAAMTGAHAGVLGSDIANFTNVEPVMQVNERAE
jgi:uncharacterized protein (TIGR02118 family)